eukprot:scaffold194479_cov24-Prasinocladus_malaysianus.AAC.1
MPRTVVATGYRECEFALLFRLSVRILVRVVAAYGTRHTSARTAQNNGTRIREYVIVAPVFFRTFPE